MKTVMTVIFAACLLSACGGGKEQLDLKAALIAKLQEDSDLKDYKLNPADVADCVVQAIADTLPGFTGDPRRKTYFEAYATFVSAKTSADADKAIETYKDLFGSVKQARAAALSVTDHIMGCMGANIEQRGEE